MQKPKKLDKPRENDEPSKNGAVFFKSEEGD
jgi:hypothetical protein